VDKNRLTKITTHRKQTTYEKEGNKKEWIGYRGVSQTFIDGFYPKRG
jgi:hypothetical protein